MKYFFPAFILLLSITCTFAQRKDSIDNKYIWAVRINPLALIDPLDLHLNVGAERRFHPSWSVATEVSWYLASGYYPSVRSVSGFMLKPSLRFYPNQGKFFLDAEFFYKQVGYHFTDWIGRGSVNGVPAYEEFTDFTVRKSVSGAHLKAGGQFYLWKNKKNRIEMFMGIGLRDKNFKIKDDPRAVYNARGGIFTGPNVNDPNQNFHTTVSTVVGFRIARMFY